MIEIVIGFLGVLMVIGAVATLYLKDLVGAIIASGVVSLFASILYLLYGAPDVAMTEAAIGSGLTTLVFLLSWRRIRSLEKNPPEITAGDHQTKGETEEESL